MCKDRRADEYGQNEILYAASRSATFELLLRPTLLCSSLFNKQILLVERLKENICRSIYDGLLRFKTFLSFLLSFIQNGKV